MASRKTPRPQTVTARDISDLIYDVHNQLMPGAGEPTYLIVPSISGTIDPYTEEVHYHTARTLFNASGIVGSVMEEDRILGMAGQIQVGDLKVTYEYTSVSGILGFDVQQIQLLTAGVAGTYNIAGRVFDHIGNTPIFVDYALKPLDG